VQNCSATLRSAAMSRSHAEGALTIRLPLQSRASPIGF
jgi:hypothetical protein